MWKGAFGALGVVVVVSVFALLFLRQPPTPGVPPSRRGSYAVRQALLRKLGEATANLDDKVGACGPNDFGANRTGCPAAEQAWVHYVELIGRFVQVASGEQNGGIADTMLVASRNAHMLFTTLDSCVGGKCDADTVNISLEKIRLDLGRLDDDLPKLKALNQSKPEAPSPVAGLLDAVNNTMSVNNMTTRFGAAPLATEFVDLDRIQGRMETFRRAAIAAVHPHAFDAQFVATDQASSLIWQKVKWAVMPGIGAAGSSAATYTSGSALTAAEATCTSAPPACAGLCVGLLGLCAAAAMMVYMMPSNQVVINNAEADVFDHDLTQEQNDLRTIEHDLQDAMVITDIMFADSTVTKERMGTTVKASVSGIQAVLHDSVEVAHQIIHSAIVLKQQDDKNYRQWEGCKWYSFCWSSSKPPQRVVPQNIADGSVAMKNAILQWGADLDVITSCAKHVDEICDKILIDQKIAQAKLKFQQVYGMWGTFKAGICEYHEWHVCDSSSVLLGLDALVSEPTQVDCTSVHQLPLALACVLMLRLLARAWGRRDTSQAAARQPLLGEVH